MEGIVAAALVMIIILALLALTLKTYANFWYRVMVADPFAIINSIMTSEEVPANWRVRPLEALAKRYRDSAFGRVLYRLLLNWYLSRLDRLVQTIKISSLIEKADKLEYIEAFKEIRADWSSSTDLF